MITVSGSVKSDLSPERAFAYLSQFEHTSEWDPGTPVVEKRSQGPVAVGHRYHAEAEFRGKRNPIEYEVIELEGNHIKLRGENKSVTAFDSIDVKPDGTGCEVTYTAEFAVKGPAKILQPFLKPAFNSLRDPALNGLKQKLQSLT
ncbi:SRPBCC family protein [Arthrobacter tecti]|uniref:Polyketide cyclase n=1 Tax=Arthrobacter pigmenti TaxID=271432 RepID=A0A846RNP0_9MICC|nr:SRPBCC family protein [Arthrobacter pigmenti]NJC22699.1 hypothetical protein [Arthrobacter pigmenti]